MPKPIVRISRVSGLGLRCVIFVLAVDVHAQLRIRLEPVAERTVRVARVELREQRLVGVASAICALQRARVDPDFGFGNAAIGFEDADDVPAVLTGDDGVADVEVDELPLRAAPGDHFVGAELEHAAFDDGELSPKRDALRPDAAHRHVRGRVRRPIFGRSMMTISSAAASAAPAVAPIPGACLMTSTSGPLRPLVISLSAPPRMTSARSGEPDALHRRLKSGCNRQHRDEHDDDAGDADDGDADELSRCGMVRMFSESTASVCVSHCMVMCASARR